MVKTGGNALVAAPPNRGTKNGRELVSGMYDGAVGIHLSADD